MFPGKLLKWVFVCKTSVYPSEIILNFLWIIECITMLTTNCTAAALLCLIISKTANNTQIRSLGWHIQ